MRTLLEERDAALAQLDKNPKIDALEATIKELKATITVLEQDLQSSRIDRIWSETKQRWYYEEAGRLKEEIRHLKKKYGEDTDDK